MEDDPDLELVTEVFAQFLTEDVDENDEPLEAIKTEFLDEALEALGLMDIEEQEKREILETLDGNQSGYIEFEKFAKVMLMKLESLRVNNPFNENSRSRNTGKQANDTEINESFQLFAPGKNTITLQDLKEVSRLVKDNATEQDLRDMLFLSGKLEVDKQEFANIIKQTHAL